MRNKFITRVQYLCTLPFIFSIIVSSQNIIFQNYLRQPNFSSSSVRFRLVSFGWITHIGHRVSLGSGLLTELWGDLSVWAALSGLCTSGIVSVYSTQRWQVSLPSVLPGCTLLTGNQGGYCKSLTNFTSSVMQFSPVGMSITFEGFGGHCSVLPLGSPSWSPLLPLSVWLFCAALGWSWALPNMPRRNGSLFSLHHSLSPILSVCGSLGCS